MSLVGERVRDTLVEDLPNLKIEIENDLSQRMETDDDASSKRASESSETEEGEVVDDDDGFGGTNLVNPNPAQSLTSQIVPTGRSILKYDTKEYVELQPQVATVKNPNGAFVTGVNIFSPEEQAKLDKRAQRFGIEASEAKVLTEKLLKKLYKSMCVKPTDKNIRTEALHMRGTEQMTTQDVFSYFKDYGPASLEWINDNSCNVVWLDDISAARALLGLSVHISGQTSTSVPQSAAITTQHRSSISDSDVEMETQPADEQDDNTENLSEESDAVAVSDLGIELPPGRWRRGAPHPLSPCILLRFATTADRSLPRPGYTKFGSHEFGGYVGLISESRRRRMQNILPTPIMFDDVGDEVIPKPSLDEKDNTNPWGSLAKTWSQFDKVRQPRPPSPIIERILPLPPRMTPPPSPPIFSSRPKLVARRRPATCTGVAVTRRGSEDSSESEWFSRSKLPRMRMHADDEEKKIEKKLKRARRNRPQSVSPVRPRDLQKRLGVEGGNHRSDGEDSSEPEPVVGEEEEEEEDDEIPDLRVAVAAENAAAPEDSKVGIRQTLFQTGNVKSVLRGARGYSENDEEEEEESEDEEKRSSRRHRSRSKERRRHHRKHKKESHHKSRRKNSDSDSNEKTGKTIKSTIKKISPEKERRRSESREKKRDKRSPRREERKRRREESYRRSESSRKSERKRYEESRSSRDLRAKLSHRHNAYDYNNEFRSKSPLQIEIDNDNYYNRTVESD